jgi:hypothetical protein
MEKRMGLFTVAFTRKQCISAPYVLLILFCPSKFQGGSELDDIPSSLESV